jgi:hypothetical protein
VTGAVRAGGDGASDGDLVTLDTPRLILRQWQATDLDRYVEMFADPEVARYIFRGQPARREQVSEMSGSYLRQWRDLRLGPFAAIDKATGAWIGQIGLNHLAYWPGPEKVEVGWELHRRWWGRVPAAPHSAPIHTTTPTGSTWATTSPRSSTSQGYRDPATT